MKFLRNTSIQLALFGICVAFGIHLWEIIQQDIGAHLHVTADDPSYYRPAFHWWQTGTWKDGTEGASSFVQRPPLMGIIHLIGYLIFGLKHSWFVFALALIFHGWGISCLYQTFSKFSSEKCATIICWVFILLPCFWGFLSYNITEAFIVSFCLITARFCLLTSKQQFQKVLICILLLILFRPVLVVLFLPFLLYAILSRRKSFKTSSIFKASNLTLNFVVVLLLAVVSLWEVRKTGYTGEVLNPHPIYHSSNKTMFQPPHQSLTELFKIWETRPEVFHDFAGRSWHHSDSLLFTKDELVRYCEDRNVPFSSDTLYGILQAFSYSDKPYEASFCNKLNGFTERIKSSNKVQFYLTTPLIGMREQALKSQLNLTVFQETYRGNILVEILRYTCLFVILACYLALITLPFLRVSKEQKWLALGAWIYGFLLFWIQRMNEDRYMLPLMAIGFICLAILTFRISEHFRKRVN